MQEWVAWFISLGSTSINWLSQMTIFNVPVIAIIIGTFLMGVTLRALLFKA